VVLDLLLSQLLLYGAWCENGLLSLLHSALVELDDGLLLVQPCLLKYAVYWCVAGGVVAVGGGGGACCALCAVTAAA
jgi:hypothetical protein